MQSLFWNWFLATVASTLVIGIHMALFKLPSVRGFNKYQLMAYSSMFAVLLSGTYAFSSIRMDFGIMGTAFLWAFAYLATTILQMKSLEYAESSSIFPFTSLLSNVFIVLIGVLWWHDALAPVQMGAIGVAFGIFFFHSYRKKIVFQSVMLPLFFSIAVASTIGKSVQKYGSVLAVDFIGNFVFWQMVFLCIFSVTLALVRQRRKFFQMNVSFGDSAFLILFWTLQFLGTTLITSGLARGPISLVFVINGFYVFVTVAVCILFFKETITRKQILLTVFSFFTILAIKLGWVY